MSLKLNHIVLPILALIAATCPVLADITPNGLFQDNMVIQQGINIPVWGTATLGDHVIVSIAGDSTQTDVDAQGNWKVVLNPLKASSSPTVLTIGDSKNTLTIKNVLVGEVWVCSGQSNMEFHVKDVLNGPAEISAADFPAIREFDVARHTSPTPLPTVQGHWDVCSPATAGQFSAAAYFFARELWNRRHIPVGLINASWGATMAEPWTPMASFASAPVYAGRLAQFEDDIKAYAADKTAYVAMAKDAGAQTQQAQKDWFRSVAENDLGQQEKWYAPNLDTSGWRQITLPFPDAASSWNTVGSTWVRYQVSIPKEWVGKSLNLHIGAVDDVDITYVNGKEVGRMWQDIPNFWKIPRKYVAPADLVDSPQVTIAVQIINTYGIGGMFGTADDMSIAPTDDASAIPISLAGKWLYKVGSQADIYHQPQMAHSGQPGFGGSDPAAIYNGMIAPLQPFAIRGVIWYQGESNANEPDTYAHLFPALITGWRSAWSEGNFPFDFVQLAQFQARQSTPIEIRSWADLRDAQSQALSLPNVSQAVISDVGDAATIHPPDKQDTGKRLALIALALTYGQKVDYTGPTFKSSEIHADTITIKFGNASGLRAKTDVLGGFAIAGDDKVFHFATATIKGDSVLVKAADGKAPHPVAVRYNWAFNPAGTLTNKSGLPASQFRTDTWPYADVSYADQPIAPE